MLESHTSQSLQSSTVPTMREFYCEKHLNSSLIKMKLQQDATDSSASLDILTRTRGFPAGLRWAFFSHHCMTVTL